jgi:hypothetical protein
VRFCGTKHVDDQYGRAKERIRMLVHVLKDTLVPTSMGNSCNEEIRSLI